MAPTEAAAFSLRAWLRQRASALLASLLVAAALAWLMRAGALPVVPETAALGHTRWWTVIIYAVAWVAMQLLRAARWQLLLAPVSRIPLRHVVAIGLIGYGAMVVLPFRMGEAVRPALIRRGGAISLMAASGTVVAERVIDGLVLSLALVFGLLGSQPLSPMPDRIGQLPVQTAVVPGAAFSAAGLFGGLFIAMAVLYWRRDWALGLVARLGGRDRAGLARWLASAVERLADGLRFLPRLRFSGPFLLLTIVYWLAWAASAWLLLWGTGVGSPALAHAVVVMGVVGLGVVVPNAPGFFGAFQLSAYAALAMFYPAAETTSAGAAFVFLLYVIQIGGLILLGTLALITEQFAPSAATSGTPVQSDPGPQ
jgi:uncharacterized protein (TIRG00374 family)